MMRRSILLWLLCCFPVLSVAQKTTEVTLYEYGVPLTDCNANFQNLFANFHKYIDDRAIGVKFLSYENVGVVKGKRQVRKLLNKNFSNYPLWNYIVELRRGDGGKVEKSEISIFSSRNSLEVEFNVKDMLNVMCDEYIHPGDSIYLLRFTGGGNIYSQYIFVNAVTKKVVEGINPFNWKIPLYHISYCERHNGRVAFPASSQ